MSRNRKKAKTIEKKTIQASEMNSVELSIIGGAIATLGDAISTYASILAQKEAEIQDRQAMKESNKIENMQKQIDELALELKKLKNKWDK